jgi:aspartate aminotransferase-like enzyme
MRYLLMIPGPVEIPDEILEVYRGKTVAHYGPEWSKLYLETERRVSGLFGCVGRSFLMPGSGSLGLDAVSTTFCSGKRCLVLSNGMFGERLLSVASMHAEKADVLRFPLQEPYDVSAVRKKLDEKRFEAVLAVQVETSTGLLNPIRELAETVKSRGLLFIVDAISSAGIEELEMDAWGVDAVVTASQKGLEVPPGLGIVTVGRNLIDLIRQRKPLSWFTDLHTWCDFYEKWHDWHPFPVTLPTNNVLALAKSLDSIESMGGIERRRQYFVGISERFRRAVSALGLEPFITGESHAHGLTAVSTGKKFVPADLIEFLMKEVGIQIAGSFGDIKGHVFRVGHMSRKQCEMVNLMSVISGIGMFMRRAGVKADIDAALQALLEGEIAEHR